MTADELIDRISRRGEVTISTTPRTYEWTDRVTLTDHSEPLARPLIRVWFKPDREHAARYPNAKRGELWTWQLLLGDGSCEETAPTLLEALTLVEERTRPRWRSLMDLVDDRFPATEETR